MTRRLRRCPGLRILTYHGVCADEVADEAWLPPHFVTRSRFMRQMQILAELGHIAHLPDVANTLRNDQPPGEPRFAITFDDGHACTLHHALPILGSYGVKATFCVATGHIDSGEWFVSDRLRVLGTLPGSVKAGMPPQLQGFLDSPGRSKHVPHDELKCLVEDSWGLAVNWRGSRLAEALRPASWGEIVALHQSGHEIAAHTVSHVILSRETRRRREAEIVNSIRKVREKTSRCDTFAYPNGGPGDFDEQDIEVLRREGVAYALTTTSGYCTRPLDAYRLPRTSVGLGHDEPVFTLEMSGWLDKRRRRQQRGDWA
ncbi:MAG: polysaccharide deacetylase family protein [Phycisphaerae bacterium]|nr:polysaccharide deacetylase family protein [Phycisphaerae bacterium]